MINTHRHVHSNRHGKASVQGRRAASVQAGEKSTADFTKTLLCKAVWLVLEEVVEVGVQGL